MELYISLAFLSALMSALLAFQIYLLDINKEFKSFLPVMFSTGIWSLFAGLWIILPYELCLIAQMFSYLGIITLPVFLLLFALDYSESSWFPRIKKRPYVIWIIPLISILMLMTNSFHGLFWSAIYSDETYLNYDITNNVPNIWFWVHAVYSYGLIIVAAVIFILTLYRQKAFTSMYALLVGIFLPSFTSILYVFGFTVMDYSPLMLSLAIILFAMAISHRFYIKNIRKVQEMQEKTSELNKLYNLVVKISEKLIQSEPEQIDEAILDVLRSLGETSNVDRTYLFLYDEARDEVSNTHEWCRDGIPSEKENLQQIPFKESVPRWRKLLMRNEHIYIHDVKNLPEDEVYRDERAILEPQGIQSLVVVPMHSGKHFAGFLGFDSVRSKREWDDESIALLNLVAGIISGSLDRVHYENKLITALSKAEEASRAKTEFLANMSHELRTPLNAILGFTQMVADEIQEGEHREHLEFAIKSSNSLLRLINDLLDFSKAEAGMLSMEPQPASLSGILDFVKKTFQPGAMDKNIDLKLKVCPLADKTFMLDEARLRQVLFNLVGNAVKFTHEGHVRVIAAATPQDNPGEHEVSEDVTAMNMPAGYSPYTVTLAVEDTGIGIREEDQQAIFYEFKQLSAGNNRYYEGTGLGLNIARRLVNLMGGKIKLSSKPGEGSRFTVVLPGVPGK